MTTEAIKLELEPRELLGKKVKQLRRGGVVPVHLYGPGIESRSLQCEGPSLIQVLARAGGNTPVSVTIRGEKGNHLAFAREIQWDPRRDDLLHVDLLAAEADRPVTAQVPIVLNGESPGARMIGGTVLQQLRTLDVEALPLEMPGQADVDLETLTEPDGAIRVSDISLPGNVTVLTDPDEVVVRIEQPRAEVVEEEPAEGEAEEGGEPAADAEEDQE